MPDNLQEDLNGLMTVLEDALHLMVDADKNADLKNTSWQIRVQCVEAILVLIRVDTGVRVLQARTTSIYM